MPNPNPTSDRALVRFRDPKIKTSGGHTFEEFQLDPPTNSIAEVEKRWTDENKDSGREWIDADLLTEPAPPAEKVEAPPRPPLDAQIVRERAAGREELPPTVTEDKDAGPEGEITPVKGKGGSKSDPNELTVAELHERATALEIEGRSEMNRDDLVKAVRKAEKKR